jgi:hypothetical protein
LTATGDTLNVVNEGGGLFELNGLAIAINVASLSTTADLTDTVFSFNGDGFAGFADGTGPSAAILLTTVSPASLSTYNLTTSIGPITGSGGINAGREVTTDEGSLDFSSVGNATFTATTTPEPATWLLFVLGFASLVAIKHAGRLRWGI